MTNRNKRTYVDADSGKWVTEENGRVREATDKEAEKTQENWDKWERGE